MGYSWLATCTVVCVCFRSAAPLLPAAAVVWCGQVHAGRRMLCSWCLHSTSGHARSACLQIALVWVPCDFAGAVLFMACTCSPERPTCCHFKMLNGRHQILRAHYVKRCNSCRLLCSMMCMCPAGHVPLLFGRCASCADVQDRALTGHVVMQPDCCACAWHPLPAHRSRTYALGGLACIWVWVGVKRLAMGTVPSDCAALSQTTVCTAAMVCAFPCAVGVWTLLQFHCVPCNVPATVAQCG
jgi:hypothetical protein